ncbi:acetyl-CoA synthetase-like protein [Aaosphaeria arxii CBS 175.79]|uniref:Acetyl-CoA synthetase-like protein n=1 Tax=Aaosphaeria arxii CBS 175.79 TaxID=1450172 RepID=A0A6A5XNG0_9PLEO|nr:acetyl-CoA synthetase-like protein [Aaosphaeria arxii CBS 175.79]KAF2013894.1 acetyl-CoA synthetase-like protein [Aaosphaeria arxii CBS 175.79]
MPFSSPFPTIDIPKCNLLEYLFPKGHEPTDTPIWIDAKDTNHNLTPRALLQWSKRLALGLDRLGSRPGEVVMIYTPNHIFVPVAYLGIVGSKRVFSGANPAYTLSEMVHQVSNTQAQYILAHPSLAKTAVQAARKAGLPDGRVFLFSDVPNTSIEGCRDWREFLPTPSEADAYNFPHLSAKEATETTATVNYSSGTTGLPKGVEVSHHNLVANLEQTIYMRYLHKPWNANSRPREVWIGFLPLYHAYGQLYTIAMAQKLQVPVYIMKQFQYEEFLRVIQNQKVTHLQVAPPIMVMLSKRPETANYDLSSVTDILCGAAPLSKELQNEISKKLGCEILQGWGMTEVTCGAIHVPGGTIDDSGSVGQLDPNCECMLLDDDGKEVAAGQPGELYIRGPQICLGYWRNPHATKESLSPDGWLKTGDVAVVKDGWFWIVDRKKELIKVNALQVAPAELEAVLLEFDPIADAAAVGITLDGQEWPRAYVHLKDEFKGKTTEEDIHAHMKDKVAKHKQLVGGISFVDEIPKLQSGKIMRKVVKEWSKRDAAAMQGQKPKAKL